MGILPACVSVCPRKQERVLDPEAELQNVVNCHVRDRIQPSFPARAASIPSC